MHNNTHTRLTALCPGLPGWAGTRKVKAIWILLKQETVSSSGIRSDICKSAPRSRQITINHASTPPSFFTGRMPFLPPNQQRQSTEGTNKYTTNAQLIEVMQTEPEAPCARRTNLRTAYCACGWRRRRRCDSPVPWLSSRSVRPRTVWPRRAETPRTCLRSQSSSSARSVHKRVQCPAEA